MLSYELNSKILTLAPKFEAKEYAPQTFDELKQCSLGGLVVWSGASDLTIYGEARVNHAFRAWHDALHLSLNAPFTLEGEKLVALEQIRQLDSDVMGRIIWGEVVGQAEHFYKYGEFPADQIQFIINYLKG